MIKTLLKFIPDFCRSFVVLNKFEEVLEPKVWFLLESVACETGYTASVGDGMMRYERDSEWSMQHLKAV